MALSLGNLTFQAGAAFSVPILNAMPGDRPYVASSATTLATRSVHIGSDIVGYNLSGVFPNTGSFVIALRDGTGMYPVTVTVQSGPVAANPSIPQTLFGAGSIYRVPMLNTTSARPYVASSGGTLTVEAGYAQNGVDIIAWYVSVPFDSTGLETITVGDANGRYTYSSASYKSGDARNQIIFRGQNVISGQFANANVVGA